MAPLLSQAEAEWVGVKNTKHVSDGDADKKVKFKRVAQGESSKGNIHRV